MGDLTPETSFNIVNRYLGWGDPGEGGIWFVGIEEASKWGDVEDDYPDEVQMDELKRAKEQIKRRDQCVQDGWYEYSEWKPKDKSSILELIAQIASELSKNSSSVVNYKSDKLWRRGCNVFQANLYPLGRPTTRDWPKHYKKLFDLGKEDLSQYEERVKKQRLDKIKERWVESKPQATVCFGTSSQYKDKFQRCFLDGLGFSLTEHPTYKIFFNDARRILICQHPASRSWRKGRSDKEKLKFIKGKLMDEWKVVLP